MVLGKSETFAHFSVISIYFILSILLTYPLILHFGTHIPACNDYDPPLYVWNSWNFEKTLLSPPHNPFIAPKLLYPFDTSVAYHDYTTVRNVIVLILSPIMNRIAAFNLVTLLMFTFSAYGAYLLTLRFTKNRFGAFISGFIFSFCPFKMGRLLGHFNFIDSAFIPFYFLFLYKTFEDRKPRNAVLMGLFLALVGYCSYYYLVFCIIFTLLFLIYYLFPSFKVFTSKSKVKQKTLLVLKHLSRLIAIPAALIILYVAFVDYIHPPPMSVRNLDRPFLILFLLLAINIAVHYKLNLKALKNELTTNVRKVFNKHTIPVWALSVLIFLLSFAPLLIPIYTLSNDYMGDDVVGFKVVDYPSLEDLVRISGLSSFKRIAVGGLMLDLEAMISIGIGVLSLIVYSFFFIKKKTDIKFWYLSGGIFILLSLGHTLQINGRKLMWMPYNIIQSIPLLRGAINPSRYIIITMLAAGIISALSIENIFEKIKKRRSNIKSKNLVIYASLLIFLFIAAEYSTIPILTNDLSHHAFYNRLAEDDEDYTVLELPYMIVGKARWLGGIADRWGLYQYLQSIHNKNLLTGYLSYIPRDVIKYYSNNEFILDIGFLQDGTNPPEMKHPIIKRNKRFQTKKFMDLLDVRYVILHKQDFKNGSYEFLRAYLKKCLPEMELILNDRQLTVYHLKPTKIHTFYDKNLLEPKNDMVFIKGWSEYIENDAPQGRYLTARKSRIIFPSNKPKNCILKISIRIDRKLNNKDVTLSFFLNRNPVSESIPLRGKFNNKTDHLEINLPARFVHKGSNLLDMEFDSGFMEKTIKVETLELR